MAKAAGRSSPDFRTAAGTTGSRVPAGRGGGAVSFTVQWPACIQCGACVAVCLQREPFISPFDTIAVETPCQIACMRCVLVCPTSAITGRGAPVARSASTGLKKT